MKSVVLKQVFMSAFKTIFKSLKNDIFFKNEIGILKQIHQQKAVLFFFFLISRRGWSVVPPLTGKESSFLSDCPILQPCTSPRQRLPAEIVQRGGAGHQDSAQSREFSPSQQAAWHLFLLEKL